MALNAKQIEFLARAIVNRLEDRGVVEFGDAEAGIEIVTRALEENFQAVDAIEQEARQRLVKPGGREPSSSDLQEEMRKVAAERNVVL
ncbi:MAG: hypothetical protein JJE51_14580 [Thermoanaerobaculia bacterium]|nr:hypothetical protein [Thermoanaerobaculia bacterium]